MRFSCLLVLALFPLSGSASFVSSQDDGPATRTDDLTEDERILHVLSRFTPGATPELVAEVRRKGINRWLKQQFSGRVPESETYENYSGQFKSLGMTLPEIAAGYYVRPEGTGPKKKQLTKEQKNVFKKRAATPTQEMMAWIFLRAVYGNNHVRNVSSDFFRNHFSVSISKGAVDRYVVGWEREIIHGQALGNFGDMLEATAKHPAMLFFLDNHLSRRPATPEELEKIARKVKKKTDSEERVEEAVELANQRGLNENYARELLELHTLGVDNYYTQKDVINVAKILTGWSMKKLRKQPGSPKGFYFFKNLHCEGNKPFLDGVIHENRENPLREGEELLEILKTHEGTAHYLSWKLCRYFVNDNPDRGMVGRVAGVFSKTGGDLPKVFQAIVDDPEFFSRRNYRAKFKRPYEFIVSVLRATRVEITNTKNINSIANKSQVLKAMNEPLYRCADPTGYYDQAEAWRDPGALAIRWTFVTDLVNGRIKGIRIPESFYDDLPEDNPRAWKEILVRKILPVVGVSDFISKKIDDLVKPYIDRTSRAGRKRLRTGIVAILLGSPEFQKQ